VVGHGVAIEGAQAILDDGYGLIIGNKVELATDGRDLHRNIFNVVTRQQIKITI